MVQSADPATGPVLDDEVVRRLLQLRAAIAREGEDVLAELLHLFSTDSASRVGVLRAAIGAADGERVRQAAHALKGAAANMGALRVASVAQRLENDAAARSTATVDLLDGLLAEAIAALRLRFA